MIRLRFGLLLVLFLIFLFGNVHLLSVNSRSAQENNNVPKLSRSNQEDQEADTEVWRPPVIERVREVETAGFSYSNKKVYEFFGVLFVKCEMLIQIVYLRGF